MKSSAQKLIVSLVCLFSFVMTIVIAIKALLLYFEKSFSGVFGDFDDDFLFDDKDDAEVEIINGNYEFAPRTPTDNS